MSLAEQIDWNIETHVRPELSQAARAIIALFDGTGKQEIFQHYYLPGQQDSMIEFEQELGLVRAVGVKPHKALNIDACDVAMYDDLEVYATTRAPQIRGGSFIIRQVLERENNGPMVTYWARR